MSPEAIARVFPAERLTSVGAKYKQYAAKTAVITGGLQVDYTYSNDSYVSGQVRYVSRTPTVVDYVNRIISNVADAWRSATGWLRGGAKSTTEAAVYSPKSKATFAENMGDTIERRWVNGYGRGNSSTLT